MSHKPYRLYMTPTSPFARKCRMVIYECGLQDQVEEFDARVRTKENEVLEVSPLGKVPTLTGPNGLTLVDSTLISEFLDKIGGSPILHGATDQDRWMRAPEWALAEGLLESLAWRTREFRRPEDERSPSFIDYEGARQRRIYDWLEMSPTNQGARDISHIGFVIALDYALYRFPNEDWRPSRPSLTKWFEIEAGRPSFQATLLPTKG